MVRDVVLVILKRKSLRPLFLTLKYGKNIWKRARFGLLKRKIGLMRGLYPPNGKARYLNIGGGRWYYPRWENIDRDASEIFVDYKFDLNLKKRIPLPDACALLIFSSHCLEHLADDVCLFVLRECHRLLKPGGVLRLCIPDMDKALEAYVERNHYFFDKGGVRCIGESLERKLVNFFASYDDADGYRGGPIVSPDSVKDKLQSSDKYQFAQWCATLIPSNAIRKEHVNAYDFLKLKKFLEEAGFSIIEKSMHRGSRVAVLRKRAFDKLPLVSLFVEAIK